MTSAWELAALARLLAWTARMLATFATATDTAAWALMTAACSWSTLAWRSLGSILTSTSPAWTGWFSCTITSVT